MLLLNFVLGLCIALFMFLYHGVAFGDWHWSYPLLAGSFGFLCGVIYDSITFWITEWFNRETEPVLRR